MTLLALAMLLSADPLPNGSPIAVEMKVGTVTVEVQARLVPCVRDRRCAQLPNGKRVTGRIEGDRFIAEGAR